MSEPQRDALLRAMTDDGSFRVITTCTTQLVREAARLQKVRGPLASRFGELITGAVLVRETMAPRERVQTILRGAKAKGTLVADSHPDGKTRGLVQLRGATDVGLGAGALLQVMRTLPNGQLQTGTVDVPVEGGISAGLMGYMQESEQVASAIAVACRMEGDEVVAAGGYIVQLLPELSEQMLEVMTARLGEFPTMEEFLANPELTPDLLCEELLYRMPFTRLEARDVSFGCQCSQVRLVASLATLGPEDLRELTQSDDVLEITCDYCGTDYRIPPEQLRGLLQQS